jgi:hypothetical protein
MADLSLNADRDLLVIGGDLVLTSDVDARGAHPVVQDVNGRLRTFLGEWYLDLTLGIPYMQAITVKAPDMTAIATAYKDQILGTPGVLTLDQFSARALPGTRALAVRFHATTVSGQVSYNDVIANSSQGEAQ